MHPRRLTGLADHVFAGLRLATQSIHAVRSILLVAFTLCLAGLASAASNVVEYTYDAAGNITNIQRQTAPGFAITSFSPTSGPVGTVVTIYGTGFSPTPANNTVQFNGTAATVTASDAGSIGTTVPTGATTGRISVTVGGSTATSATDFVVTIPGAPTISSFTPTSGAAGTTVTVTGTNFDTAAGATTVKLNGVTATATVTNDTSLAFTVPAAAASGKVTATTSTGTGTSATDFIVPPAGINAADIVSSVRVVPGGPNANIVVPTVNKNGVVLFDAQPNVFYSIQFNALAASPTTATAAYKVIKPDNTVLLSGSIGGTNRPSVHLPMLPTAGTYGLVLSPGSATLNTNVRVEVNPVIGVDGPAAASTQDFAYQSSRFVFNATANQRIGIGLVNLVFTPANINTVYNAVRVFRPDGVEVSINTTCAGPLSWNPEGNCDAELLAPVTGTYTLIFETPSNAYGTFSMQLSSEVTGTLAADVSQAVTLSRVGQDARFTFSVNAGDSLALDLSAAAPLPRAQSIKLNVYKPDGSLLTYWTATPPAGIYGDLNTLASAGTYTAYVDPAVGAYGSFNLTLKQGPMLLVSDPPTAFAPGGASETARFRFSSTAGQNLSLGVAGLAYDTGSGSTTFSVYAPNGTAVGTASSCSTVGVSNGYCRMTLTNLPQTGTYSVALQPPSGTKISGNISLSGRAHRNARSGDASADRHEPSGPIGALHVRRHRGRQHLGEAPGRHDRRRGADRLPVRLPPGRGLSQFGERQFDDQRHDHQLPVAALDRQLHGARRSDIWRRMARDPGPGSGHRHLGGRADRIADDVQCGRVAALHAAAHGRPAGRVRHERAYLRRAELRRDVRDPLRADGIGGDRPELRDDQRVRSAVGERAVDGHVFADRGSARGQHDRRRDVRALDRARGHVRDRRPGAGGRDRAARADRPLHVQRNGRAAPAAQLDVGRGVGRQQRGSDRAQAGRDDAHVLVVPQWRERWHRHPFAADDRDVHRRLRPHVRRDDVGVCFPGYAVKTMRAVMRSLLEIVAVVAVVAGFSSGALAGNCYQNGGQSSCASYVPTTDWKYQLCDDTAAYVYREVAWCIVYGGTWGANGCVGASITADPGNASGLAGQFEHLIHGDNTCDGPPPAPTCSNYYCNCNTLTNNGVLVSDFSLMPFHGGQLDQYNNCQSWAENVVLSKARSAGCPEGYVNGGGDADTPCVKNPPCKECAEKQKNSVGNPIDVGTGTKIQVETDYRSAAPGGLAFERIFNSAGFFDLVSRMETPTDKWRHTYSTRVIPYAGNAYVMAAVQEADGTVRPFNLSGVEMQNNDGAANRLQKLTDGSGNVTGWRLTTASSDVQQFDAQGKLSSITTRAGFVTTLAYSAGGQLTTVTDAFGRTITLTYDAAGNIATMTDPASRLYQYGYDAKGNPASVTYPDNSVRTYVYEDASHPYLLTGIVDERGIRFATYAYNTNGYAISTQHAGQADKYTLSYTMGVSTVSVSVSDAFNSGYSYTFSKVAGALKRTALSDSSGTEGATYDANGNVTSRSDRLGHVTTYVYDATRNLETSRTEASGTSLARTITTTWNPTYRLPATITEPSGVSGVNLVTTFTYDPAGNLTKKNMTAGASVREWNYTYNARGQVLTIDGPRTDATDVTTITYYADNDSCVGCRGQVYTVTNAASQVTTFNAYDADGRPAQITDANGVVTTLTYKPRGWLASRSTAGETTIYDYDTVGNLTKVTLPDGSWVAYTYDDAARLVGVDDNLGDSIDYQLDLMGNRVMESVYDPQQALRKSMQRVYDGMNRIFRELGSAGQTTEYTYDHDILWKVTDPRYNVTTNSYDQLNRLINILDPANGNTVFTYDAKDHLKTVKDPKLTATTTYNYDGLGNLTSQVSPDTGTTAFTYDAAGNVTTQTDARSTVTTYAYDALNRVTAATVTDGTVTYEYDNTTTGGPYALGRLTKVTDPSGNTTYAYDALGRVTSKAQSVTANPANKTFTVGYSYASGRQTGITYPSGRAVAYGFDAQGHVTSITVDGTTSVLANGEYFPFGPVKKWVWGNGEPYTRSFDLDGRVKTITLGPAAGTYADLGEVFGYDSLNRLINANLAAGQTQGFTYDANGNRTNATINAASTTYTYPGTSHKLTSLSGATTRSFTYDNAGNVTVSAGLTYTYDGRGRMKQAGTTTYALNGLGQRVKKTSGTDVFFAYDEAGHLIGEYDATGASIQETIWLGDLPVAVLKPKTGGFDVFYVWADHLGTPRQITDTLNQSRWEWPNADPFGNNVPNENPAGLGTFSYNLRFPGQYYDSEKGSNYNYFRDYDPGIGRYVESDPIGLEGGLTTYGYVLASPLGNADPTGELGFLPGWAVNGAAGFGDAFLVPELIRNWWGIGSVDKCSTSYAVGKGLGFAVGLGPFALRGLAATSGLGPLRFLNSNRYLRVGPGRMPGNGPGLGSGTNVPRMSIGEGPGNPHFDLRTRIPPPPPIGGPSCECQRSN